MDEIKVSDEVSLQPIGPPLRAPWWLRAAVGEEVVPVVALHLAERCEVNEGGKKCRMGVAMTGWIVWQGEIVLAHDVEGFKGFGYAQGDEKGREP
jgi:hypothetical protein